MQSEFKVTSLIGGESMLQDLEQYFNSFIAKRTEEIGVEIVRNNLYYKELADCKRSSLDELIQSLSDTNREKVFNYEDQVNYQVAFVNEIMYRQGLLDGLNCRNTNIKKHVEAQFMGDFKEQNDIK